MRTRLLLALVALALLAPVAGADHVYSHRYLVHGRVVDAAGAPVPGVEVRFAFPGLQVEGGCGGQAGTQTDAFGPVRFVNVTNARGEFMTCAHAHAMPANGSASVRVTAPGLDASAEAPVDPEQRWSYLVVRLDAAHPAANASLLAAEHTVLGRAWRPGPATLEGVRVLGATAGGVKVAVTLHPAEGEPVRADATTNPYGDFAVRLPLAAAPGAGRVVVEAGNITFEAPLDASGATALRLTLPAEAPPPSTPSPPPTAASTPTPGGDGGTPRPTGAGTAATPPPTPAAEADRDAPGPGAALALAAAALALVLARRRRA